MEPIILCVINDTRVSFPIFVIVFLCMNYATKLLLVWDLLRLAPIKMFAINLPSQPFLGRHFGFHIFFHPGIFGGHTLFLQLGCFGLDIILHEKNVIYSSMDNIKLKAYHYVHELRCDCKTVTTRNYSSTDLLMRFCFLGCVAHYCESLYICSFYRPPNSDTLPTTLLHGSLQKLSSLM